MTEQQPKLIRKRIPGMIRNQGSTPRLDIPKAGEYRALLREKLSEEVAEFLAIPAGPSGEAAMELADILEVVYAIAADLWITPAQLEDLRKIKAAWLGDFDAPGVVWKGNQDVRHR